MQCATHPQIETHLRCSRCSKAICFRCMVGTPVGYRCRECAQIRRLPMFILSPMEHLQATGAAVALAFLGGVVWAILREAPVGFFAFLSILTALGIGYAIGEGIGFATNRKRATFLQVLAGASALLSYIIGNVLAWVFWTDLPFSVALNHAFDGSVWRLLSALLAAAMAVTRLR